jgi:hypothetical protein
MEVSGRLHTPTVLPSSYHHIQGLDLVTHSNSSVSWTGLFFLTPEEKIPHNHWEERWTSIKDGLDMVVKSKLALFAGDRTLILKLQPVTWSLYWLICIILCIYVILSYELRWQKNLTD